MAKRYGRNQKRAHRSEIERLSSELVACERNLRAQTYRANEAYSKAFNEFCQRGDYFGYAVKEIANELARSYPPKLREAAELVMKSRRDSPPIRFDAKADWSMDAMEQVVTIRGEIPGFRYNIAIR